MNPRTPFRHVHGPPLRPPRRRRRTSQGQHALPVRDEFSSSLEADGARRTVLPEGHRRLDDGLLNEGMGCWGRCDSIAGDCAYCGTGQCCRASDHRDRVPGCELAERVVGAKCGAWRGEFPDVMNVGLACFGACGGEPGDCEHCGIAGQCCRRVDGERCEPGCELAFADAWVEGGPASQCGAFRDPSAAHCSGVPPPPAPTAPAPAGSGPSPPSATGLLNEGLSCGGTNQCNIVGGNLPGDCDYCGTGQCCNDNDWRRGVPGCELAENVTGNSICGAFSQPRPEPYDFRLGAPHGVYPTPPDQPSDPAGGLWIKDIVADGSDPEDHAVPGYNGDGGQPWSKFEMALVRDLLLFQMRLATAGRDELSAAKFIRLPFHDCLLYSDGTGGCDGCVNWENVGFRYEGRVESRNSEDHERESSNNGLGDAVQFLECVYTLDLGKTWASGCYLNPGTVSCSDCDLANTRQEPIWVTSIEECRDHCLNTPDCQYFTVTMMRIGDSNGPCRLLNDQGNMRSLTGTGRLIAGNVDCPAEGWSLQSQGKSRADLWAFASLVAVEEGIQRHNWACDGDRRSPHNGPIVCTQFEGEDQCRIMLRRPFAFKTGRKDCDDGASYTTEKKEDLPDEHFNRRMTVRFMEDHYGLSAKETVTIMGAHTVGAFHQRQTGHKYVWTSDFQAFNIQFYRNIAGKED